MSKESDKLMVTHCEVSLAETEVTTSIMDGSESHCTWMATCVIFKRSLAGCFTQLFTEYWLNEEYIKDVMDRLLFEYPCTEQVKCATFKMIILTYLKKLMSPDIDSDLVGSMLGIMAIQRDVFLLKHFWEAHAEELGPSALTAICILEMLTSILHCSTIDEIRTNFEDLIESAPMITTATLKCILQHKLGSGHLEIMNDVISECDHRSKS